MELPENKNEGLTLEKARQLLGDDNTMNDEELNKIIDAVKVFCKVAYELYQSGQEEKQQTGNGLIIKLTNTNLNNAA